MAVHDDNTEMQAILVVRRISSALNPSTPRKYSAPTDGIHGARSTNWKSAFCGLYQNHSGTETANPMNATTFAIKRMAFSFCLFTSSRMKAPASGVNRMIERRSFIFYFVVGPHPHDLCLRRLRGSALRATTFRSV